VTKIFVDSNNRAGNSRSLGNIILKYGASIFAIVRFSNGFAALMMMIVFCAIVPREISILGYNVLILEFGSCAHVVVDSRMIHSSNFEMYTIARPRSWENSDESQREAGRDLFGDVNLSAILVSSRNIPRSGLENQV